jgi:choline dehydrogenase
VLGLSKKMSNRFRGKQGDDSTPLLSTRTESAPVTVNVALVVISLLLFVLAIVFIVLFGVTKANETHQKRCGDVMIPGTDECVDVIIIGGGTAGLAMARALTEDDTFNVLVIEAGDDDSSNELIRNPDQAGILTSQHFNEFFWQGESIPQSQLGGSIYAYTNGRTVGGGSTINGMQVVRGSRSFWDYVDAASGFNGVWDRDSIFERYRVLDDFDNHGQFAPGPTRGDGSLPTQTWKATLRPVNQSNDANYIANLFSSAYAIPIVDDYNEKTVDNVIFRKWQYQQDSSTPLFNRSDAQTAFMDPSVLDPTTYLGVGSRRLRLKIRSEVIRMLWDDANDTHCIGVQYYDSDSGIMRHAYASKTVVLSANIQDAQKLQLEGIGPAATLAAAGVEPRVINEHVGRHWMNHPVLALTFLSPNITGVSPDVSRGNLYGGGGSFLPDPSPSGNPSTRGFQIINVVFNGGFAMLIVHGRPLSSGTIDIQNSDPLKAPLVDHNYLDDERDVVSWREFIRDAVAKIQGQDPGVTFVSLSPGDLANNATLDAYVASNLLHAHHWSTGARMSTNGWDPVTGGVVDYRTRVFNVTGLRVCDCMIMPEVSDGNLATPAVVIGHTCAELIIEDFATPAKKRKATKGHGARNNNMYTPETYRQTAEKYAHQRARAAQRNSKPAINAVASLKR